MRKTICALVVATVMGCAHTSSGKPDYIFNGVIDNRNVSFERHGVLNMLFVYGEEESKLYTDVDGDLIVDYVTVRRNGVSSTHRLDAPTTDMMMYYVQKEFEDYLLKIDAQKRADQVMKK